MPRISEKDRESGTYDAEESEAIDRVKRSETINKVREVLRLQKEHFLTVLSPKKKFDSLGDMIKFVIKPANDIAKDFGFRSNLEVKQYKGNPIN